MSNILFRIKQISDNENVNITSLETKIGASKGVLSRALKNNTDIVSKWITKIVENFPRYNTRWLLTGEGEMLVDKSTEPFTNEEKVKLLEAQVELMEENKKLLKENSELKIENMKLNTENMGLKRFKSSKENKRSA